MPEGGVGKEFRVTKCTVEDLVRDVSSDRMWLVLNGELDPSYLTKRTRGPSSHCVYVYHRDGRSFFLHMSVFELDLLSLTESRSPGSPNSVSQGHVFRF